ncbi:S41 family peptidase [Chryseobacterium balustinum]|uniref:Tail-specific protease n=2 Tax=Chryseobacterium balustinum TaxID=246 RepID=A0AAX2ILT9_9FLAO|nr:S41 family peptidase [Chryseobacterium balustinum]AZB29729.1 tetratricopeptide repeat protein [Chryseobacterium balustinum]SKB91400.1 Tetratricopeptide repeat-containing protein [Chryseobacterium balustinum]SQA90092.1 Tail-specific protease precursor [Chryseobacterium balustinum]
MKVYFKTMLLMLLLILQNLQNAKAQEKNSLQTKEKREIITSIKTHLAESYIDLDLSKKMITELDKNLKSKTYDKITSPAEFSKKLTEDLQSVSKDLHLKVQFEPERIAQGKLVVSEEKKLEAEKKMGMQMAEINYGFTEAKILDGNIGYLNLRMFSDVKYAEETATATMNFLSNTKAIIIDLRTNGGGVPSMMQLLSSYFFDETPVLLSDFYERKTDTKTQLYSLANVNGKRSSNKPIYILTSKQTFSAAEAFAYTLKNLNKAIVVGEVTKGGANRTKRININEEFTISVPYIQSIHPITKTNWEGKGVHPNINTNENEAFVYAYIDAINKTNIKNIEAILNKIGYAFLKEKSVDNAIIVFQENAKLSPNNANNWDSLGEAYFINGDKENALKSYQKALALDPNSESAKAMIQKLETIK